MSPWRTRAPQRLDLLALADRRRALRRHPDRDRVLLVEREVVRARLAGDVDAPRSRLGDEPHAGGARDVDDVQRAPRLLRQLERAPDRAELGDDRPRVEVVAEREAPLGDRLRGEPRRQLRVLRMHCDGKPEPGGARHPGVQRLVVRHHEVVDAGRAHERLEADDAALGELVEAVDRPGHEPAPEGEVDDRRLARGGELEVEGGAVDRRRARVQRHVDERRRPSCRERAGRVGESLPVGPPRLVAVHVRVDNAGEDVQPGRVDRLGGIPSSSGATATTSPSAIPTSLDATPTGVTTTPPRTMRSNLGRGRSYRWPPRGSQPSGTGRERPGEACHARGRCERPWAQAAANEEHGRLRARDELATHVSEPLLLPALGETEHDEPGVVGGTDELIGSRLDEQRLGCDAEHPLDRERSAREQPARSLPSPAPDEPARRNGSSRARAIQAASSIAAQSCAAPENGTRTGRLEPSPAVSTPTSHGARARNARDDLVLDQRGRRVDEDEIDVLLGREPNEVAAGVGRAERGGARGEPVREQSLPRLVEEGGCGSEVAGWGRARVRGSPRATAFAPAAPRARRATAACASSSAATRIDRSGATSYSGRGKDPGGGSPARAPAAPATGRFRARRRARRGPA